METFELTLLIIGIISILCSLVNTAVHVKYQIWASSWNSLQKVEQNVPSLSICAMAFEDTGKDGFFRFDLNASICTFALRKQSKVVYITHYPEHGVKNTDAMAGVYTYTNYLEPGEKWGSSKQNRLTLVFGGLKLAWCFIGLKQGARKD